MVFDCIGVPPFIHHDFFYATQTKIINDIQQQLCFLHISSGDTAVDCANVRAFKDTGVLVGILSSRDQLRTDRLHINRRDGL